MDAIYSMHFNSMCGEHTFKECVVGLPIKLRRTIENIVVSDPPYPGGKPKLGLESWHKIYFNNVA